MHIHIRIFLSGLGFAFSFCSMFCILNHICGCHGLWTFVNVIHVLNFPFYSLVAHTWNNLFPNCVYLQTAWLDIHKAQNLKQNKLTATTWIIKLLHNQMVNSAWQIIGYDMGYFCGCFSFEFWTASWIARHHRVIFCLMVFKEGISVFRCSLTCWGWTCHVKVNVGLQVFLLVDHVADSCWANWTFKLDRRWLVRKTWTSMLWWMLDTCPLQGTVSPWISFGWRPRQNQRRTFSGTVCRFGTRLPRTAWPETVSSKSVSFLETEKRVVHRNFASESSSFFAGCNLGNRAPLPFEQWWSHWSSGPSGRQRHNFISNRNRRFGGQRHPSKQIPHAFSMQAGSLASCHGYVSKLRNSNEINSLIATGKKTIQLK